MWPGGTVLFGHVIQRMTRHPAGHIGPRGPTACEQAQCGESEHAVGQGGMTHTSPRGGVCPTAFSEKNAVGPGPAASPPHSPHLGSTSGTCVGVPQALEHKLAREPRGCGECSAVAVWTEVGFTRWPSWLKRGELPHRPLEVRNINSRPPAPQTGLYSRTPPFSEGWARAVDR